MNLVICALSHSSYSCVQLSIPQLDCTYVALHKMRTTFRQGALLLLALLAVCSYCISGEIPNIDRYIVILHERGVIIL